MFLLDRLPRGPGLRSELAPPQLQGSVQALLAAALLAPPAAAPRPAAPSRAPCAPPPRGGLKPRRKAPTAAA